MFGFSLNDNNEGCLLGKAALTDLWHKNFPNGALMNLLRSVATAPGMLTLSINRVAKTSGVEMGGAVSTEIPGLEDNICIVLDQLAGLKTVTELILAKHQPEGAMMQTTYPGEGTSTAYITIL